MQFYEVNTSVLRVVYGEPFDTEAVLPEFRGRPVSAVSLAPLETDEAEAGRLSLTLEDDDIILGLGQTLRGMNKRGGIYESWCYDEPDHSPEKRSLYGAHNFLILDGGRPGRRFGIFVDFPGKVTFDAGFGRTDRLEITIAGGDFELYLIRGESPAGISAAFRRLIGRPYLPPRWAFGYQQSRWGYDDAATVEELGRRFREEEIPCDAIYLDIEYMERYKDFTVHPRRFPDFESHVARMRAMGFRLVPIIDAGVKIEEGYSVYEEGLRRGHFCTDADGRPFTAAVWPGKCHFPDVFNPAARRWFGSLYRTLTEAGIEGFWNDMNEPAIFYTEEGMEEAIRCAEEAAGKNLGVDDFFTLKKAFAFQEHEEYFHHFFHRLPDGRRVNHADLHNLYGTNLTRAAAEGLEEIDPDRRFLLFSRASYVGMHRYAGIWTGDNSAWWDQILVNLTMLPALNMCGLLYSGADIGGHIHHASGDLVSRWTQLGVFVPLLRNHSTREAREQDPFAFDEATTDRIRMAVNFRYALIPWLYGQFLKAAANDSLLFTPLSFGYEDERSRRIEDQLLLGDSLMLAPVYRQNALGRYLYAPEPLLLWKVRDYRRREYAVLEPGDHWIDVAMDEIPLLIRPGGVLLLGRHAQTVDDLDLSRLEALIFAPGDRLIYELPWDDGISPPSGEYLYEARLRLEILRDGNGYRALFEVDGECPVRSIAVEIADKEGATFRCEAVRGG